MENLASQSKLSVFGNRLAECRRGHNLTQEEMANHLGVTPQALSKWERGTSCPNLLILSDICLLLHVSADYLMGTESGRITEDGNEKVQREIWDNLRAGLEPLELFIGEGIVPAFGNRCFVDKVKELRLSLSKEGFLMPVVHIKDQPGLLPGEFQVLSYRNILYDEEVKAMDDGVLDYIVKKLGETVQKHYADIINADIVKSLTDNLKIRFPALIEGIVPERISYGLLTDVIKEILKCGCSPVYLPKAIEIAEHENRENGTQKAKELAECVLSQIKS